MHRTSTTMTHKELLAHYREQVEGALEQSQNAYPGHGLYEPCRYLMSIGGKRLRPSMVLAAAGAFGADPAKALHAAVAVETFHNFTLMHDDIMDKAPLRRGMPTVHEKWNDNTAILSGDAMFVQAYDALAKSDTASLPALLRLFNQTAREVCEGQQLDMEFEQRNDVSIDEYLEMIRLKTSVLLAAALQMGAIIAGAEEAQQKAVYDYGIHVGLAFQLQDDYLDAFGDPETFGKQVGGDILADKKTFLYLSALQFSDHGQRKALDGWLGQAHDPIAKVDAVRSIFLATGADNALKEELSHHYRAALTNLEQLNVVDDSRGLFRYLAQLVGERAV